MFELSLELLDDPVARARATMNLGVIALDELDFERGRAIFAQAQKAFEELGDEHWAIIAKRQLAWAHYDLGEIDRARALHNEVILAARKLGMEQLEAQSLGALGEYAAVEGNVAEATPLLKESWRIFYEIGDPNFIGASLCRFARVLAAAGHADEAAQVLARAEAVYLEDMGRQTLEPFLAALNDGTRELIQARLDGDSYAAACERGRAPTVETAVALALDSLAVGRR